MIIAETSVFVGLIAQKERGGPGEARVEGGGRGVVGGRGAAAVPGDGRTSRRPVSRVPLSCRRPGVGPSALFLCEVLGALRRPRSAHAPGRTVAAAPSSLREHHVQFHGDVEVSGFGFVQALQGVQWEARGWASL